MPVRQTLRSPRICPSARGVALRGVERSFEGLFADFQGAKPLWFGRFYCWCVTDTKSFRYPAPLNRDLH